MVLWTIKRMSMLEECGHKNIVLWFSGGKDSMSCLYLLKNELKNITVLWANTGKYYPELLETVSKAKKLCPNWKEIKTDRDSQWKANGLPSDLVPIDHTLLGQRISSKKKVTIQSYLQCRWENISAPLWEETKRLGATLVIRGQRADETHKSDSVNGFIHENVSFWHPIEDWTKEKVLDYLKEQMGELPKHYELEHSSMDCYDCTAFAEHSHDRAEYTKNHYPDLYKDYQEKIRKVHSAIAVSMEHYTKLIG